MKREGANLSPRKASSSPVTPKMIFSARRLKPSFGASHSRSSTKMGSLGSYRLLGSRSGLVQLLVKFTDKFRASDSREQSSAMRFTSAGLLTSFDFLSSRCTGPYAL